MDRKAWQAKLCNRVRELRLQADLSQMEFANRADVSHHAIGKIERREVFPALNTLIRLSEAHGIPLADFFSDPAKASTRKDRTIRDLTAILRRQDERKLDLALGLVRYLLARI